MTAKRPPRIYRVIVKPRLVLFRGNYLGLSWSVIVHGKARLAANGLIPSQEAQRSYMRLQANPVGYSVVSRGVIAALGKDRAIV
jgi:hypothetical protein